MKICRSDVLTKEFLEECFVADFEEGVISWKIRPRSHFSTERAYKAWNTHYAKTVAGSTSYKTKNYFFRRVTINKMYFPVHHIVWTMFNGEMIDTELWEIDHIDRNPLNNSITNLRKVDRIQNSWNTLSRKTEESLSRFKGVTFDKSRNKWILQFKVGDKKVSGRFERECDAGFIYRLLCENFHGEYLVDEVSCYEFPVNFCWNNLTPTLRKHLEFVNAETREKFPEFFREMANNPYVKQKRGNRSGVDGVYLIFPKSSKYPDRDHRKFVAHFKDTKKSFSVAKYGYDRAFELACQWAEQGLILEAAHPELVYGTKFEEVV